MAQEIKRVIKRCQYYDTINKYKCQYYDNMYVNIYDTNTILSIE